MKHFSLLVLLLSVTLVSMSQSKLKPSLGLTSLPSDSDPICPIPLYLGEFDTSGLYDGDSAVDFTLYTLNGDPFSLSDTLASGKPVLIVTGSYTCPVFRNAVSTINQINSMYSGSVSVVIVYTVEAHPDVDVSPYFGYVNPGATNISQGILYEQPTTYLERKDIISDMFTAMTIDVPVIIDGPCNNFWEVYGPAPNNAYLIDTSGAVVAKHDWFNKYPHNIFCDLDTLLNQTSGMCGGGFGSGSVSFELLSNDTVTGVPGQTLYADLWIKNTTNDDVLLSAIKLVENYATDWETSFCTDVCYPTTTDTISFIVPANDTMFFHFYFYTHATDPGFSGVRLGFKNLSNATNEGAYWLYGHTYSATEIKTPEPAVFNVYPNPAEHEIRLETELEGSADVKIVDMTGKTVVSRTISNSDPFIDVSGLSPGLYMVVMNSENTTSISRFVKH